MLFLVFREALEPSRFGIFLPKSRIKLWPYLNKIPKSHQKKVSSVTVGLISLFAIHCPKYPLHFATLSLSTFRYSIVINFFLLLLLRLWHMLRVLFIVLPSLVAVVDQIYITSSELTINFVLFVVVIQQLWWRQCTKTLLYYFVSFCFVVKLSGCFFPFHLGLYTV